jgi:hypothetical protein
MGKDDIKRAGDVLEHLFGSEKAGEARRYASFFSNWDQLVGPQLAGHFKPKDIEKGVLIVETDHPGWLQMFQMSKERILRSIHSEYPELEIKNLRCILGNPAEKEKEAREQESRSADQGQEESGENEPGGQGEAPRQGEESAAPENSRLHRELEKLRRHIEERDESDS